MNTSILNTVKPYCNVDVADVDFDTELKIHINSAFATLRQIGAGPSTGFQITGTSEKWSAFSTNAILIGFVKEYVCNQTALKFDKSASGTVVQAMQEVSKEALFRIQVEVGA